jgi:hypothetical protein
VTAAIGPLVAVGGSTLAISGNALDLPAAADVFLSVPGTATEWTVTIPWRQNTAAGELDLLLPNNYADPATSLPAPPAATPLPGLYNLTVGSGTMRSNPVPLLIAPRVDNVTNPPLLSADASGLYSIVGAGFVPGATTLSFGATALTYVNAATPSAGQFTVDASGAAISFLPPAAAAAGSYPVLIAVSGFAASTGWVVVLS